MELKEARKILNECRCTKWLFVTRRCNETAYKKTRTNGGWLAMEVSRLAAKGIKADIIADGTGYACVCMLKNHDILELYEAATVAGRDECDDCEGSEEGGAE